MTIKKSNKNTTISRNPI